MSVLLWVQLALSLLAVAARYVALRSIVVIGPAEVVPAFSLSRRLTAFRQNSTCEMEGTFR